MALRRTDHSIPLTIFLALTSEAIANKMSLKDTTEWNWRHLYMILKSLFASFSSFQLLYFLCFKF